MIDPVRYPRTACFLREHPNMTLDDLLAWTEIEINKLGAGAGGRTLKE